MVTPLGEDKLLLTGFKGHEAISRLFHFQLDLLAEAEIPFDRIVGQNVSLRMQLAGGKQRCLHGLIKRFSQGARDETFMHYRAELVPALWRLTKKVRSRVFQRLSVPDILRQALSGMNVTYELSGTYHPRDYCVQYRESDFDFVSRLMEEEGIYYFFTHTETNHQMVVADASNRHPSIPEPSSVIYGEVSSGVRDDSRVAVWEKTQELRSGEYTLWDHSFELPGNHLEATEKTSSSINVGKVVHKLNIAGNDQLETYDYPGGYAQRFDGVEASGAPRPQDLRNIFEDRQRTVRIRMEQEEAVSLEIAGTSDCGHFIAGHKFTLQRHFDGDGQYLLTRVEHDAQLGGYRGSEAPVFSYQNRFTCIPVELPYRPQRVTPKPVIAGVQTATVVGPPGEEIFCDKYGRVKAQFHWDREGKKDAGSSCWLRVAQPWAGNGWGAFFWPRIGHEVVVAFEEGDPDQPLIIGSVYNAENMPPFELPMKNNLTGFKSASFRGRPSQNFNGIVFDDTKGHEHLGIHSERHMSFNSEFDKVFHGGRHKGERVSSANIFTVGNLPGGGGSGGGFDDKDYTAFPHPAPLGVPGLNSTFVYGENLQVAVGLNHQIAVGNNLQICINPPGLAAGIPELPLAPALTAALGSSVGGNMQFTIGSSASFVLGQAFDINLGPPKIEIQAGPGKKKKEDPCCKDPKANPSAAPEPDADSTEQYGKHVATEILCGVLAATVGVWALFYGIKNDDYQRAHEVILFQAVVDLLLLAIMEVEVLSRELDDKEDSVLKPLYRASEDSKNLDSDSLLSLLTFGSGLAFLGAIAAPILATQLETGAEVKQSG